MSNYYEREAQYSAGLAPTGGKLPGPPDGPTWRGGEPANLAAAAEDADRWLEFLQEGRTPTARETQKLADCRAALRKLLGSK